TWPTSQASRPWWSLKQLYLPCGNLTKHCLPPIGAQMRPNRFHTNFLLKHFGKCGRNFLRNESRSSIWKPACSEEETYAHKNLWYFKGRRNYHRLQKKFSEAIIEPNRYWQRKI